MKTKKRKARLKTRQENYDKMVSNTRIDYKGFKKPGSNNK